MVTILGIDHIVLRTDKLDEMLSFYCDVLGCDVERETDDELGLTQLRAGNALIDLVDIDGKLGRQGGQAPTKKNNNLDHFCLQLAPVSEQEIEHHLTQHGISVPKFERRYGAQGYGLSVYINDPQGNTVELRSHTSQLHNN
ncbi:VOC family protein [Thalassotalea ganghwensis]